LSYKTRKRRGIKKEIEEETEKRIVLKRRLVRIGKAAKSVEGEKPGRGRARVARRPGKAASISDALYIWPKIVSYAGLSDYEAKVYLCLVYSGSTGARRLSMLSNVPRSKVYDVVRRLVDLGLVVELPGAPKRFVAAPPSEAFGNLVNIARNRVEDFGSTVELLTEINSAMTRGSGLEEIKAWHLSEEDLIVDKFRYIIRNSSRTLTIFTNEEGLSLMFKFANKPLDDLNRGGVEVKIFTSADPSTNALARELSYLFEVKRVDDRPILFVESDGRIFIIAKVSKRGDNNILEDALLSEDASILATLRLLLIDAEKLNLIAGKESL